MNPDNPYKKIYRSRTERIMLNSYRVQQQLLHEEYVANLDRTVNSSVAGISAEVLPVQSTAVDNDETSVAEISTEVLPV